MAIDDSDERMRRRLTPNAPASTGTPFGQAGSKSALQPTVTIGGAPAGYAPAVTQQPTVTIGGALAGYAPTTTPNYITGAGVKGSPAYVAPTTPNYITGEGVPGVEAPAGKAKDGSTPKPEDTPADTPGETGYTTGQNGELLFNGKPFTGTFNGIPFVNGFNQNDYDETGKARTKVVPGSTGLELDSTRTLAKDTFKNTLALYFGTKEMSQPWADALYRSVSGFYNTGATVDEALNLSLQEVRTNPVLKPFTDRFAGVYALTDRLRSGEAIEVPTIAEFFKSEAAAGDVLRQAGMGELATQKFLGNVLGLGKSVLDITNLINETFNSIDNAPEALRKDIDSILKLGVSRVDIAKALLTGKEGAVELNKKIAGISTFSAAKSQGVAVDMGTAADIAASGYDYGKSLTGFGNVKRLERGQTLGRMSGIDFTQEDAIASTFRSSAAADEEIRRIEEEERNRFAARSGRLASQSRAQGLI